MTSQPGESPLFSVVSGRPGAEDLAALTAVLAARLAARQRAVAAQAAARTARSAWLDRAALPFSSRGRFPVRTQRHRQQPEPNGEGE